jgi:hypothetical protein
MAKNLKVGERLEQRSKPAPAAEELAEQVAQVASNEKFPSTFAESIALLAKVSAETVSSEEEWDAKQPMLRALKAHVFAIQQGLPIISTNEHVSVKVYGYRRAGLQRTKLNLLAREHVEVKELLAHCDALEKRLSEKQTADK